MKKLMLFGLLLCFATSIFAQKIEYDEVHEDGSRIIGTDSPYLFTNGFWSSGNWRISCIMLPEEFDNERIYSISLSLTDRVKHQISKGNKLLIKFEDNSMIELVNNREIGPADYTYKVTQYGTYYTILPSYPISESDIAVLKVKKPTKIRIITDLSQIDGSIINKNNKPKWFSESMNKINAALSVKKDIYSDF